MTRGRIVALALICGVLMAVAWQRNLVAGLRLQNETLLVAEKDALRLIAKNHELATLKAASRTDRSDDGALSELLRLRSEVGQLRAQRVEWNRLKAENDRIAAEIGAGVARLRLSEMEGYLAKESWSNAGFDTPEAALQTYFWAMREGDFGRLAECMPPKEGQYLAALTQPGHEQEREQILSDLRLMTQGVGFRIVEKVIQEEGFPTKGGQPVSSEPRVPTKVLMRIQAVAGGAVMPISLRLYEDGWKVKD